MNKQADEKIRHLATRYVKTVEWNAEDRCYVGHCPELFYGGVHGMNEAETYRKLCEAVEDVLISRVKHGDCLPAPAVAEKYSGRFVLRIPAKLHKALAVRAFRGGVSLNDLCLHALRKNAV